MKFKVKNDINLEELKAKIEAEFPSWDCKFRSPKILIVNERGSAAAAQIMPRKGKVIINEGFTTLGGQMLFSVLLILLGIIIPFAIYALTLLPKQKAIRDKVGAYVKEHYGDNEVV